MYNDIEIMLRKDALIAALEFLRKEEGISAEDVTHAAEQFLTFLAGGAAQQEVVCRVAVEKPAQTDKPKRAAKKQAAPEPAPKEESDDAEVAVEEPTDSSTLTQKEVIDALREMLNKTDRDVLVLVLKKFGVTRAGALIESQYREVFDIAQAVLIEDDTEAVLKKYGVK